MKVAYLGPHGSFSEEAAFKTFKNGEADWQLCDSILEVLEAVGDRKVEKGIVPIENSIEGTINITADGLLANNLFIEEEVVFPVSLKLLVNEGAKVSEIREVWSISPALAQCKDYIRKAAVKTKEFDSTSSAARALKEQGRLDAGAIASSAAARLFDLQIANNSVQDNGENHTRFIVVGKRSAEFLPFHKRDKIMLLIAPALDQSGVLSSILNVFSALSINLTWIESRPTKKRLGTYHFFLEAETGQDAERTSKALKILRAFGHEVQVLGSYNTTRL
ncbi:prephenate dehydratase [Neobacillus notoginsengisoli]|uniref:Prephenate dehydratase n=1 Tax=Neobacillus notoginsengisoli TaxID=1578198 RepID=A0A417YWU0_9BACI|nr:prephenate dehydratase [Neobacillus notoginsengisoli]RHW42031.1 prephenate dehydratase [Neobacillus notoginsengisoli]